MNKYAMKYPQTNHSHIDRPIFIIDLDLRSRWLSVILLGLIWLAFLGWRWLLLLLSDFCLAFVVLGTGLLILLLLLLLLLHLHHVHLLKLHHLLHLLLPHGLLLLRSHVRRHHGVHVREHAHAAHLRHSIGHKMLLERIGLVLVARVTRHLQT